MKRAVSPVIVIIAIILVVAVVGMMGSRVIGSSGPPESETIKFHKEGISQVKQEDFSQLKKDMEAAASSRGATAK